MRKHITHNQNKKSKGEQEKKNTGSYRRARWIFLLLSKQRIKLNILIEHVITKRILNANNNEK
jgi:hypothetical protein